MLRYGDRGRGRSIRRLREEGGEIEKRERGQKEVEGSTQLARREVRVEGQVENKMGGRV